MANLNKLTKAELIARLEDLQAEYYELKEQYNELDDLYGELETDTDDRIEELEKELESIEDLQCGKYDYLLSDISTNTYLQNKIYDVFKAYYLGIVNLYCINVPNEVIEREKINRVDSRINKDIIKVLENYIEDLALEEDIKKYI